MTAIDLFSLHVCRVGSTSAPEPIHQHTADYWALGRAQDLQQPASNMHGRRQPRRVRRRAHAHSRRPAPGEPLYVREAHASHGVEADNVNVWEVVGKLRRRHGLVMSGEQREPGYRVEDWTWVKSSVGRQ